MAILQAPDGKGIPLWQPTRDKRKPMQPAVNEQKCMSATQRKTFPCHVWELTVCDLQYVSFPTIRATLIVAVLHAPGDKHNNYIPSWQPTRDRQTESACMEYNKWICLLGLRSFLDQSLAQYKAKGIVLLSCELEDSQTIFGLCIIPSHCSYFNCCSTPSSR